jgi:hypothetical protein
MKRTRRSFLAIAIVTVSLVVGIVSNAAAQRDGRGCRVEVPGENPTYDGRFTFARIRYETGGEGFGFRRGRDIPGWLHDHPCGERHLTKILAELTTVRARTEESVVLALDDPELFKYPVAYMSEPGYWRMGPDEATALGAYLKKGGFIMFDDFREDDWFNLVAQMERALPDHKWVQIDGTHQLFDSFYLIPNPELLHSYGNLEPTFWVLFEENDPTRRIIALANRDNDLSEVWEYSGTGQYPVDVTNEAYKIGINYIVYALSR